MSDELVQQFSWLTDETGMPSDVAGLRDLVGRYLFDQGADWYQNESNLERLAEFVQQHESGALAYGIHDASDSPDIQRDWLGRVAHAARYTQPEQRADYMDMYYRYDKETGVYEWYDPADPGVGWISQDEADAKIARAQEAAHVGREDASPVQPSAGEPAPYPWDENWGMFYRMGPTGAYEFADARDDAKTAPGDTWLTAEQVEQRRRQGDAPRPDSDSAAGGAPTDPGVAEAMAQQAVTEVTARSEDLLKGIDLSAEEFGTLLAEIAQEVSAEFTQIVSDIAGS